MLKYILHAGLSLCASTTLLAQSSVDMNELNNYKYQLYQAATTTKEYINSATGKPMFAPGVVIVKLRQGVPQPQNNVFFSSNTSPEFGIPSLQERFLLLGGKGFEQMFPSRQISEKTRKRLQKTGTEAARKELELVYKIYLPIEADVVKAAELLQQDPNIEYAEPDYLHYPSAMYCSEEQPESAPNELMANPNDTELSRQAYLNQISAPLAWDVHKGEDGEQEILVSIVDSGVEWYHPDLVENLYHNLGEDANKNGRVIEQVGGVWQIDPGDINGRDDDGDGFADNFFGYNFVPQLNSFQTYNPDDANGHGTHVAGIAVARTNNARGVAAVSWNVKFIATAHGGNNTAYLNTSEGVQLSADMGADIINCSFGYIGAPSQTAQRLYQNIANQGVLIIAAAGNEDTEAEGYPSDYQGVLSITSVNRNDRKATYSNYRTNAKFSAPGGDFAAGGSAGQIYSTYPGGRYVNQQGTSMASPVAASAFALLKSFRPNWTRNQLIDHMTATADNIDNLNPNYVGKLGPRINIGRALTNIGAEVIDFVIEDSNKNNIFEPNEELIIRFLRLDLSGVNTGNKNFILRTETPGISILDSSFSANSTPAINDLAPNFTIRLSSENTPVKIIPFSVVVMENNKEVTRGRFDIMIGKGGVVVHERGRGGITGGSSGLIFDILSDYRKDVHFAFSNNRLLNYLGADALFIANSTQAQAPLTEQDAIALERFLQEGGKVYMDGMYNFPSLPTELQQRIFSFFGVGSLRTGLDPEGFSRRLSGSSGGFTGAGMSFTAGVRNPIPQDLLYGIQQATGQRMFLRQELTGTVGVQTHNTERGSKTLLLTPYTVADIQEGVSTRKEFIEKAMDYFEVKPTSVNENGIEQTSFRAFPNPVAGNSVQFILNDERGGEVRLHFYDYTGREVLPSQTMFVQPNMPQNIEISVADLPSGMYFVRCASLNGSTVQTTSFVVK